MHGLHTTAPPSCSPPPLIPGTPNPPPHSNTTPTISNTPSTSLSSFQASVDYLQAQNTELDNNIESFQSQMQSQFSSFQQNVLDVILRLQPPSTSTSLPQPSQPINPLSFGSLQPISTTWTGLGLSSPTSPLLNFTFLPGPSFPSSSHCRLPHSSPVTYSTVTSIPNQFISHSHSTPSSTQVYTSLPQNTLSSPQFYSPLPNYQPDPFLFKPPKVDLSRFNGDDVVGWLAMAEHYIRVQRIPPQERIPTVASHFGPDAFVWMNAFEQRHPHTTWEQFIQAFLEHFGSTSNSDFKALLSHLQHISNVDDYISAFTKLSCCAPEWFDDQLLPIFCGGLKPEIRHDVMALEPATLVSAQRLALWYEAKQSELWPARSQKYS